MPGSRRRAHRRRHGPHRGGPQGPRRERHARPLPAERAAAGALRPRRDHGLERGADLAARHRGAPALAAAGAPSVRCDTVRRTVIGRRAAIPRCSPTRWPTSCPSRPTSKPGTKRFLDSRPRRMARDLDPTLPISVDIKGRPGYAEQFTYHRSTCSGINQYFGWYRWVEDFDDLLEPYIREMRDLYPREAIVMTEWGAEGAPGAGRRAAGPEGQLRLPDLPRGPHARRDRPLPAALGSDLLDAARVRDLPRLAGRRRPTAAAVPSRTRATTRA